MAKKKADETAVKAKPEKKPPTKAELMMKVATAVNAGLAKDTQEGGENFLVVSRGDQLPKPKRLPTGLLTLDWLNGGGDPCGLFSMDWGEPGTCKCVNRDSLCLTEKGMYPIASFVSKDMEPGDYLPLQVKVATGKDTDDQAAFLYYDGKSPSICVNLRGGYRLTGTPNHRIKVATTSGMVEWRYLSELHTGDVVALARGTNLFGPGTTSLTEDDAYWLGLLYGDGCLTEKHRIQLSNMDDYVFEFSERYLQDRGIHYTIAQERSKARRLTVGGKTYRQKLADEWGVGFQKSIDKCWPLAVLTASRDVVGAFIRGLFDTDGGISTHNINGACLNLALSNEAFMRTLQTVLLNFGIVGSLVKRKTTHADSWRLSIYAENLDLYLQQIGLNKDNHRLAKLQKAIDSSRKRNSNRDVLFNAVPLARTILKAFKLWHVEECGGNPKQTGRLTLEQFIENYSGETLKRITGWIYYSHLKRPPLETLRHLIKVLGSRLENQEEARQLVGGGFFFAPITKLENVESDNFDFVVPRTKTFVANGFINHNTSKALFRIACAQRIDPEFVAIWLDGSGRFSAMINYAQTLGVDLKRFFPVQCSTVEQGIEVVRLALAAGAVDLVVADDLAVYSAEKEMYKKGKTPAQKKERAITEESMAVQALANSKRIRRLQDSLLKHQVPCWFTQQVRAGMDPSPGAPEFTIPGGFALRHILVFNLFNAKAGSAYHPTVDSTKDGPRAGFALRLTVHKMSLDDAQPNFTQAIVQWLTGFGIERGRDNYLWLKERNLIVAPSAKRELTQELCDILEIPTTGGLPKFDGQRTCEQFLGQQENHDRIYKHFVPNIEHQLKGRPLEERLSAAAMQSVVAATATIPEDADSDLETYGETAQD